MCVVQSVWPDPQPGYLSLHQTGDHVVLKWTPNSLMDGGTGTADGCSSGQSGQSSQSASWHQAVTVNLHSILYMHCHQVRQMDHAVYTCMYSVFRTRVRVEHL